MKKIVQAALAAIALGTTSFAASAGYPGEDDCELWEITLRQCQTNGTGTMYGMTCHEVHRQLYYCWIDRANNNVADTTRNER